ncbi:MAG: hypothetical protein HY698_16965 [Deltaproteobacteria bacterium]|nr:hypothetical protein [Deltaproteobacteria bacterium]
MNCWEAMKCGREAGGECANSQGVCPAYTHGAGEACWLIAGTYCAGEVQGTFAQKEGTCMLCPHYRHFDLEHRARMRIRFARFLHG